MRVIEGCDAYFMAWVRAMNSCIDAKLAGGFSVTSKYSARSPGLPSGVRSADSGTASPPVIDCEKGTSVILAAGITRRRPSTSDTGTGHRRVIAVEHARAVGMRTDDCDALGAPER